MRKFKGYILAEILTAMLLQAGFIVVLCGAFYLLVSFSSNTQQVLTARERGERVIMYVDQKISNAGLGLQECTFSNYINGNNEEKRRIPHGSKGVREALSPLITNADNLGSSNNRGLRLPVALSYANKDNPTDENLYTANPYLTFDRVVDTVNHKIQYGNFLTLLYAERETDTDVNLVVVAEKTKKDTPNTNTRPDVNNPLGLITENWSEDLGRDFIKKLQDTENVVLEGDKKQALNKYNTNIGAERGYSISSGLFCAIADKYYSILAEKTKVEYVWGKIEKIREEISKFKEAEGITYDLLEDIYFDNYTYNFISGKKEFDASDFENTGTDYKKNIKAWGVMAGTGIPLIVLNKNSVNITLQFAQSPIEPGSDIHTGDELLYLKCERMFVFGGTSDRNFYFETLGTKEKSKKWSDKRPYQDGILEIYFELDTNTNILDLYVLASGGTDGKIHSKPKTWPENARWKNEYQYHVMYVSRASWKLNNIPDGFNWNS